MGNLNSSNKWTVDLTVAMKGGSMNLHCGDEAIADLTAAMLAAIRGKMSK